MTAIAIRIIKRLAGTVLALSFTLALTSCGSGAVSDSSGAGTSAITITPAVATLYSDMPTTFILTGGNGSYVVTSSNQAVIGFTGNVSGNTLTVVPASVGADTPVTLTVGDTGGHATASSTLTVKPRTVSNVITVTPSASQSTECGTSICSGGDAEVKVTLAQNGVPLVGRAVRFDVVSGDVRIITSAAGSPETLGISGTTTSDGTGTARMRVRVLADAPGQTALIQVTDLSSGFAQTASIAIAPSSNAPLTVRPTQLQFTGTTSSACSNGVSADIVIIGGRPPYQVTRPAGFNVTPLQVNASGGRVTVTSTGQCARTASTAAGVTIPDAGQSISIIDSNGASASVLLHNDPAPSTVQTSPFTVGPTAVKLTTCDQFAAIALAGGSGTYFAASGNSAVAATVTVSGSSFSTGSYGVINRQRNTDPTGVSPVPVTFSDGQTVQTVTVTLSLAAATSTCP